MNCGFNSILLVIVSRPFTDKYFFPFTHWTRRPPIPANGRSRCKQKHQGSTGDEAPGTYLFASIFVPKIAEPNGIMLSAATSVKDINRIVGCHIPENMANTLGGVMTSLAGGRHQNIGVGNRLSIADVELQVISSIDGLIKKVRIDKLEAGAK